MPRFMIERNFADAIEVTKDGMEEVRRINDDEGVRWLFSFLSADKRKTYCLYEAPNAEAIRVTIARERDVELEPVHVPARRRAGAEHLEAREPGAPVDIVAGELCLGGPDARLQPAHQRLLGFVMLGPGKAHVLLPQPTTTWVGVLNSYFGTSRFFGAGPLRMRAAVS
jgi:hypothetical protein